MADLERLEERYRDAQEAFASDRSDSNYKKYKKAKTAYAEARTEQKRAEEADPDHPRGQSLASVTED